jgi:nitrate reductase gamma subunit
MLNNFLFIGLPYIALSVMVAGTIIRYRVAGFSVSSLSSQFLESNDLFRGIRPFHWGILLLFFGHLSGFLFPRTVILFGAIPIRLFIIEASAFGFGLLSMYGLTMLIIRRLQHERLYAVTIPLDVSVYLILSLQIISGLWVAFFARWGSVWFASVIAPYLKSIFTFTPDIVAVSAMPMSVKIHIISAFILIGMIPFTRFMHFLVYPFTYLWRSYQYVIWYWDRKKIRSSGGVIHIARPKNN